MGHCIVEALEEGIVFFFTIVLRKPQGFDTLDQNLGRSRLCFQQFDHLSKEVPKRHGLWIACLTAAHQLGLNVGRSEFDHLNIRRFQLISKRLAVRVNRALVAQYVGVTASGMNARPDETVIIVAEGCFFNSVSRAAVSRMDRAGWL